jgi:predicted nuclease of predicted toxin-antitoxin system
MILVDENIDDHITEAIRSINVDVYSVAKHTPGIKDEEIIELSRISPRIILTEDKDFGEWVFSHRVKGVSVILLRYKLRYKFSDTKRMIEVLLDLLNKKIPDLIGKFTVVTINKIRIRDLER